MFWDSTLKVPKKVTVPCTHTISWKIKLTQGDAGEKKNSEKAFMQSCDMCLSISKTMKIFTKMDGSRQLSECSCLDPSKIDYLTCGAFDCTLSDSPWQLFARLIGKWREFRPSSSWVFGSWEVGNSGSRDSKIFEIPKYKNIQRATIWNTIDSEVGVLGMYESFDKILSLDQKLSGIEKP